MLKKQQQQQQQQQKKCFGIENTVRFKVVVNISF